MRRGLILTGLRVAPLTPAPSLCISVAHKSSGKRPKKKIYHRVADLDRAMDLQKKPSLILQLKSAIQSQKDHRLLLRDLEKHFGFVQKWNFMSLIQKYPTIFSVGGGGSGGGDCWRSTPPFVELSKKARRIVDEEEQRAMDEMEPILVANLRKLLMMAVDCRVPLETIKLVEKELGLPHGFEDSLIPRYPRYFTLSSDANGKVYLCLEDWNSSLAVTAREERIRLARVRGGGELDSNPNPNGGGGRTVKRARVSRDGNFSGPYAFRLSFPAGFRPNVKYLKNVETWQKISFLSPYLNARRIEHKEPKARKRNVAVLHELLSLTMEKRLTSAQLDAFHAEYFLPSSSRLLLFLIRHHGIFYITNKGARSTVFLKEAYNGPALVDKCPLLMFNDKFLALSGRREISACSGGMAPS